MGALKAEREATRVLEGLGVNRAALDETRFGRLRDSRDVEALLRNPTKLEHSRYRPAGRHVVLVERPLDAIAYEQKHGKMVRPDADRASTPALESAASARESSADLRRTLWGPRKCPEIGEVRMFSVRYAHLSWCTRSSVARLSKRSFAQTRSRS